jgi:hypothetical protein
MYHREVSPHGSISNDHSTMSKPANVGVMRMHHFVTRQHCSRGTHATALPHTPCLIPANHSGFPSWFYVADAVKVESCDHPCLGLACLPRALRSIHMQSPFLPVVLVSLTAI